MIEAGATTERPASSVARKAGRRARHNQAMRLVRRAQLYAGLFMTPWVSLYGITALLFDHPDAFPDAASRLVHPAELSGTSLGRLSEPARLAAEVVENLEVPGYQLVRAGEAGLSRELAATPRSEGRRYNIRIDPGSGEGSVRAVAERPKGEPAPFASRGPKASGKLPPLIDLKDALPSVLARLGWPSGEVTMRTSPESGFLMEGGGRTWRVQYDLATGVFTGRPGVAPGEPLSSRRPLTRLHLAHGYPGRPGIRRGWAVAVDLMSDSMVGWGITGLLMWWQMKSVRRVGLVVLALSGVVAAVLTVGMHESLTGANSATRPEASGSERSADRRRANQGPPGTEGRPPRAP